MVSYRLILGLCSTLVVQAYTPQHIMVDVTNDFGVCVLQIVASKNENVAFSPYGLVTVALILYEGSAGPTAAEIHNSLRLPWERDVTRIGFRDLHRYLKSYFTNDGFLRGLVLSKPNVVLRTNYTNLLDFYGFDIRTGVTTVRPTTTTPQLPAGTLPYVPATTPRAPQGPPTMTTMQPTETPQARTTPDSTKPVTTMPPTTRRMTTVRKTTTTAATTITTSAPRMTTTMATRTTVTTRGTTTIPTTVTAMPTTPPIIQGPTTTTTPATTTETAAPTTMTVTVKRPATPEVMSQMTDTVTTMMPESKDNEMDIDVQTTTELPETTMEIVETKITVSQSTSMGTNEITTSQATDQMATSSETESATTQIMSGDGVPIETTTVPIDEAETLATTPIPSEPIQETTTVGTTTVVTTENPPVPTDNEFSDSQIQEKATRHERSLHSAHLALEHRDGLSNWVPHYKDPRWNLAGEQWFFTYSDGDSVPVLTYTAYLPFAYVPELQSLALQIPLDDPRYSMVIILPEERLGLFDVLYLLQWCPLKNVLSQLKVTAVYAVIPSFTLVKHINLRPVMTQLGIRSLFDPYRADLSTMSAEPNLFVKTIEQVVTVSLRKYYSNHRWFDATPSEVQQHFIANHPFLYFVIDRETEVTLMAGTIVNPRAHPQ